MYRPVQMLRKLAVWQRLRHVVVSVPAIYQSVNVVHSVLPVLQQVPPHVAVASFLIGKNVMINLIHAIQNLRIIISLKAHSSDVVD